MLVMGEGRRLFALLPMLAAFDDETVEIAA
jgi:hypothetical protein